MVKARGETHPETAQDGGPAAESRRRGERLVAIFIGAVVALNFPLLSLFLDVNLVLGVPALYLYLFSVWAVVIAVAALVLRGRPAGPRGSDDKRGTS